MPTYPVRHLFPEHTTCSEVSLGELLEPAVRLGVAHWEDVRGCRRFPRREDLDIAELGHALANVSLIRVIGDSADFQFRVVGDEVRRAHRSRLDGRVLSDLVIDMPRVAQRWRELFGTVVNTGLPVALRISIGPDTPEVNFSRAESVCLPLGHSDQVDHLLNITSHVLQIVEEGASLSARQ